MGWKGTIRKINATNRKVVRKSEKRRRELVKQQNQLVKMQELDAAKYEVEVFNNRIDLLKSVHKDCSETWDWASLIKRPPFEGEIGPNEAKARQKLDSYSPGLFGKLFNNEATKKEKLRLEIIQAKNLDEEMYQDWKDSKEMAEKVLVGDQKAYIQVINEVGPFSEIAELGSNIKFTIIDDKTITFDLFVHSDSVIPSEIKTVTKAGKLSTKAMPKTQFYEIYQDYVCGSALRVARETFALLPNVEIVYINAIGEVLDTTTGLMKSQCLLSVKIPQSTLKKLNFDSIDCSDSMVNFVHNMVFQKTKGFQAVEKIEQN